MDNLESLRAKLDDAHDWPCVYTFKCVIPSDQRDRFLESFPDHQPTERGSRSGKYISMTLEWEAGSSGEIVEMYREAATIPGAILL
jgi:putative lipoic acid-binding regulatory protein